MVPLVLIGPGLVLLEAVVGLAARGPLGWLAAAALLVAVWKASAWTVRRTLRWWASTKAPDRTPEAPRPRPY